MSEFSNHRNHRINKRKELFHAILKSDNVKALFEKYEEIVNLCVPSDIVYWVNELVQIQIPMPEIKSGINKLLYLLHRTILEYPYYPQRKGSLLAVC